VLTSYNTDQQPWPALVYVENKQILMMAWALLMHFQINRQSVCIRSKIHNNLARQPRSPLSQYMIRYPKLFHIETNSLALWIHVRLTGHYHNRKC